MRMYDDQQNDELINLTFKGVVQHFNEVFSELVQGGHGYLVMMKKKLVDGCERKTKGQVVELLLSLGKSERGFAITCLKSVLCWTSKRVCVWCVRISLSKTWIAHPHASSPFQFEN
ncbi:hypothetical protein NC653_007757 [Populus alba x Populus x berolinensis]|uniref:Uncharacterized protein n=1 Tax=Populus alba x Populus x berolinensis TaxID=444605 RepID=A0AAD6R577_9ROSI|nr:hypothetical protein NC653_007757 [Populus alba x Populus x berolinensis]